MAKVRITPDLIRKAMQHELTRQALADRGASIQSSARALASSEGVDANFWNESGTRPGGRPFTNVYCDNADQEFGTSKTERRRILGRAAEENR